MIALLVLSSLFLSIKGQRSSCLSLEDYEKYYKTDLSECHKRIANQKAGVNYEGRGGYGQVISCDIKTDTNATVKIAVKMIELPAFSTDILERRSTLVDNELVTLDNINRLENIWLPLYYGCIYDFAKKAVYIFMEHLDTTLRSSLKEYVYADLVSNNLHVKALRVMLQIARGVEGVHKIGMAHMDLHLGNIMLDMRSGVVKLIDFGLVCIAVHDKYKKAVESENLKYGFITGSKMGKIFPEDYCTLSRNIRDVQFIFMRIAEIILEVPILDSDVSLMSSDGSLSPDDKQFIESMLSIFYKGRVKTLADVVSKLKAMLAKRTNCKFANKDGFPNHQRWDNADRFESSLFQLKPEFNLEEKTGCEFLDEDEFSKNYRRQNAEKFKLDLFQLRSKSARIQKYEVSSFEALKEKVLQLERTNIWPKRNYHPRRNESKQKKHSNCSGCFGFLRRIFRKVLI